MHSFRASIGIVDILPGVPPEAVLEAARAAVAAVAHVEDAFVDVSPLLRGDSLPRVVVRFGVLTEHDAAENAAAWRVARAMAAGLAGVATTTGLRAYRRAKGRWPPIADPEPEDPGW